MTIADKITTLNGIKQDIKAAIEAKGVTVGSVPFGDYDTKISEITGGGGGIPYPPLVIPTWNRPADWLTMPTITSTENKVAILVAVFPNGGQPNKVALSIDTIGFTVDWGDGDVTTHSGSTYAEHTYDFTDSALDGTLTTLGYKQAMIIMTPTTGGQNIPNIRFNQKYTGAPAGTIGSNYLDILVSAPACTYAALGNSSPSVKHFWLERFRFLSANLNDINGFFYLACPAMCVCEMPRITSSLNATNMFAQCYNLIQVALDCSTFTFTSNMFANCYSLVYAGLTSTANATYTTNMFQNCYSLKKVDGINLQSSVNCAGMFQGCGSLITIDILGNNTTTSWNGGNLFNNCSVLKEIKGLNLSKANTLGSAFYNCYALISLKDIPPPTAMGSGGWTAAFYSCRGLVDVFDIYKGSAPSFNSMFRECMSLQTINIDTTAGITDLTYFISACVSLSTLNITTFDTSSVTTFNTNISNAGCFSKVGLLKDITVNCSACTGVAPNFGDAGLNLTGANVGGVITLTNSAGLTKLEPYTAYGIFAGNYNAQEFHMSSAAGLNADLNVSNFAKGAASPGALQRIVMPGMRFTFSVAYNSMSANNIDEMFTALGIASGAKTVTVTGNPGAAWCTPSIATAKGWTVVQ